MEKEKKKSKLKLNKRRVIVLIVAALLLILLLTGMINLIKLIFAKENVFKLKGEKVCIREQKRKQSF